jgi:aryl-alcohol dehydrogenase-like predicted oxidoreductase
VTSLPPGDVRKRLPRFRRTANQVIADAVRALAEKKDAAPAQLALPGYMRAVSTSAFPSCPSRERSV